VEGCGSFLNEHQIERMLRRVADFFLGQDRIQVHVVVNTLMKFGF
jgi:hypothetical protein